MSDHRLKALQVPLLSMLIGEPIDITTVDDCLANDLWVAREQLLREAAERRAEAEARRKMSLEIISAGYRALAAKYHPDMLLGMTA
jgi:hypothetical protein